MWLIIKIGMRYKMSDVNNDIKNEDSSDSLFNVDQLKTYVESLFVNFSKMIDEKFEEVDKKIESFEKQIATLVIGFGEQAVFLEALLAQLAFSTEEEQKTFQNNVNESRKQMLKVMKDGSKNLVAGENERLAEAINDVVDSKSSDFGE
jgi:hypothetical protein